MNERNCGLSCATDGSDDAASPERDTQEETSWPLLGVRCVLWRSGRCFWVGYGRLQSRRGWRAAFHPILTMGSPEVQGAKPSAARCALDPRRGTRGGHGERHVGWVPSSRQAWRERLALMIGSAQFSTPWGGAPPQGLSWPRSASLGRLCDPYALEAAGDDAHRALWRR